MLLKQVNLSSITSQAENRNKHNLQGIYSKVRDIIVSNKEHRDLLDQSIRGMQEADEKLRLIIANIIETNDFVVAGKTRQQLLDYLCYNIYGFGPAQPYMFDPEVSEIMVNGYGPKEPIRYEKNGYKYVSNEYYMDAQQLNNAITRMLFPLGETVNDGQPSAQTRLPDGSRLTVAVPPICLNGPSFTIRRFTNFILTPEEYIQMGAGTQEMFDFLKLATKGRANILVCGGTSTGKTTLLRALCTYIPKTERILTIEDTEELQLKKEDPDRDVIAFLAQKGRVNFSIRDCLLLALRERPDRIVIGEVRGTEAVDLIDAMRTGHEAMGTLHVSTPVEAIERLGREVRSVDPSIDAEILYDEISRTIDLIIQLKFFKHKGERKIVSIVEPIKYDKKLIYREIFTYSASGHAFKESISKSLSEKLLLNGMIELLSKRWCSSEFTSEERKLFS